jgi:hypothetical protein
MPGVNSCSGLLKGCFPFNCSTSGAAASTNWFSHVEMAPRDPILGEHALLLLLLLLLLLPVQMPLLLLACQGPWINAQLLQLQTAAYVALLQLSRSYPPISPVFGACVVPDLCYQV